MSYVGGRAEEKDRSLCQLKKKHKHMTHSQTTPKQISKLALIIPGGIYGKRVQEIHSQQHQKTLSWGNCYF